MTAQNNIFYGEPDLTTISTQVIAARPHHHGVAVALEDNIARAAGGGEPRDIGRIAETAIAEIEKKEGMTWIVFNGDPSALWMGSTIEVDLDHEHRERRRRLHTAVHLAIRSACNHFGTFHVTEAEIAPDAFSASVTGNVKQLTSITDIALIDRSMRSEVLKARPVTFAKAKSIEHAEKTYGSAFRVSDRHAFRGKVRLVCIDGFDVNPCAGLHHLSSDIGPYEMIRDVKHAADGVFRVRLSLSPTWMYWFGDRAADCHHD